MAMLPLLPMATLLLAILVLVTMERGLLMPSQRLRLVFCTEDMDMVVLAMLDLDMLVLDMVMPPLLPMATLVLAMLVMAMLVLVTMARGLLMLSQRLMLVCTME